MKVHISRLSEEVALVRPFSCHFRHDHEISWWSRNARVWLKGISTAKADCEVQVSTAQNILLTVPG